MTLILFFRIAIFSSILLKEILSSRGLEEFWHRRKASVIDTEAGCPNRFQTLIKLQFLMSSWTHLEQMILLGYAL